MIGSLFLFPAVPGQAPPVTDVIAVLRSLNMLGEPMQGVGSARVFWAGEGFARHVIYAGCSPHLRFEPKGPDDRQFCHVAVHGSYPRPVILTGVNTVKPRCPNCRKRLSDWRELAAHPDETRPCPGCGQELTAAALDWRQHAAVGRSFVELRNVFPGEATPSDQLMATLEKQTGMEWRYAWSGLHAGAD